jgi:hypothetical protein
MRCPFKDLLGTDSQAAAPPRLIDTTAFPHRTPGSGAGFCR